VAFLIRLAVYAVLIAIGIFCLVVFGTALYTTAVEHGWLSLVLFLVAIPVFGAVGVGLAILFGWAFSASCRIK
jgi:hypothetical protein